MGVQYARGRAISCVEAKAVCSFARFACAHRSTNEAFCTALFARGGSVSSVYQRRTVLFRRWCALDKPYKRAYDAPRMREKAAPNGTSPSTNITMIRSNT